MRRRLGFLGHTLRLPAERADKRALFLPATRRYYESDLGGRSLEEAAALAEGRDGWRSFTETLVSAPLG